MGGPPRPCNQRGRHIRCTGAEPGLGATYEWRGRSAGQGCGRRGTFLGVGSDVVPVWSSGTARTEGCLESINGPNGHPVYLADLERASVTRPVGLGGAKTHFARCELS